MKLPQFIHVTSMGIISCVLSLDVAAHALWLEKEAGAIRLYFGEYAENLREPSPGRLDSIIEPKVTVVNAKALKNLSKSGARITILRYRQVRRLRTARYWYRHSSNPYVSRKGKSRLLPTEDFSIRVSAAGAACRSISRNPATHCASPTWESPSPKSKSWSSHPMVGRNICRRMRKGR